MSGQTFNKPTSEVERSEAPVAHRVLTGSMWPPLIESLESNRILL